MNEKLKSFLDKKKAEERSKYDKKKEQLLLELDLYEQVYSPNNEYSTEYPYSHWDSAEEKQKYYKRVPIEITDEEYEELRRYTKRDSGNTSNPVATALVVIAWFIFIAGFIAGIALGVTEVETGIYYKHTETEFSFATAFIIWCLYFVVGTMFLGFAEIIKLLEAIKRKK